jgi:hypothetical protein
MSDSMATEYFVLWEVNQAEISDEEIESALTSIQSQIEEQTDDNVATGRVHDFDLVSSGAVATYVIGVGSALTAQAIVRGVKSLASTEDATVKADVDVEVDEVDDDGNVNVDIDLSINED